MKSTIVPNATTHGSFLGLPIYRINNRFSAVGLWWCSVGKSIPECIDNAEHLLNHNH